MDGKLERILRENGLLADANRFVLSALSSVMSATAPGCCSANFFMASASL
jgi:hypothetical protein